jgi:hypothetical protein
MIFIKRDVLVPLLEIECRWCGKCFCICRCCWRGQCYCCEKCRDACRRKAHREAQRRYRRTEGGRTAHREAEKRRRVGLSKKSGEIVDDAGTTLPYRGITILSCELEESIERVEMLGWRVGRCHFCGCWGVIVERFPRRGYGRRRPRWEWEDERYD